MASYGSITSFATGRLGDEGPEDQEAPGWCGRDLGTTSKLWWPCHNLWTPRAPKRAIFRGTRVDEAWTINRHGNKNASTIRDGIASDLSIRNWCGKPQTDFSYSKSELIVNASLRYQKNMEWLHWGKGQKGTGSSGLGLHPRDFPWFPPTGGPKKARLRLRLDGW